MNTGPHGRHIPQTLGPFAVADFLSPQSTLYLRDGSVEVGAAGGPKTFFGRSRWFNNRCMKTFLGLLVTLIQQ